MNQPGDLDRLVEKITDQVLERRGCEGCEAAFGGARNCEEVGEEKSGKESQEECHEASTAFTLHPSHRCRQRNEPRKTWRVVCVKDESVFFFRRDKINDRCAQCFYDIYRRCVSGEQREHGTAIAVLSVIEWTGEVGSVKAQA